jgi:hypothetical protein
MRLLKVTTPYMSGPDVVACQKALHENKYEDFFRFKIDGQFGPVTANRCAAAKWHLGYPARGFEPVCGEQLMGYLLGQPLPPDYLARRKARASIVHKPHPKESLGEKALDWALTKVGQHENPLGSNNSFATEEWGHGAMPWCAVYVSLAYIHSSSPHFSKSAQKWQWVPGILQAARNRQDGLRCIPFAELKPGDLIVHGPGAYHITMHDRIVDVGERIQWDVGGNEGNLGYVYHDIHDASLADAFIRVDG